MTVFDLKNKKRPKKWKQLNRTLNNVVQLETPLHELKMRGKSTQIARISSVNTARRTEWVDRARGAVFALLLTMGECAAFFNVSSVGGGIVAGRTRHSGSN